VDGLKTPDYSAIDRITNRLKVDRDESPASIAVNSPGVMANNGGNWIMRIWKIKKRYLNIHFAVDVKTR
jgi:hypothetical protein